MFSGGKVPFISRPSKDDKCSRNSATAQFSLIGVAFVDGMMDGEPMILQFGQWRAAGCVSSLIYMMFMVGVTQAFPGVGRFSHDHNVVAVLLFHPGPRYIADNFDGSPQWQAKMTSEERD